MYPAIRYVNGRLEMEQQAIALLRKGLQPAEVSINTGLSQTWLELQARKLGKRPYEMALMRKEKKK